MTAGDPETFVRQLEEALAAAADRDDPDAIGIREHVAPLIDEHRGRRTLTSEERDAHAAWLTDLLRRQGAKVREILSDLGGELQDIDHQAAVDRFLGRGQD